MNSYVGWSKFIHKKKKIKNSNSRTSILFSSHTIFIPKGVGVMWKYDNYCGFLIVTFNIKCLLRSHVMINK